MFVYLASPIDQAGMRNADHVRNVLVAEGYTVFDPSSAFSGVTSGAAVAIEDVNRWALYAADLVVAFLPSGVPTIGVPMEIEAATALDIPTVVLLDEGNKGSISIRAKADKVWVFTSYDQFKATQSLIWTWVSRKACDKIREGSQAPAVEVFDPNAPVEFETDLSDEPDECEHELKFSGHPLRRAHPDDAGFDLVVSQDVVSTTLTARPVFVPCGLHVELPENTFGWVVARSSTMREYGLHVLPGIIDRGYAGEIGVSVIPNQTGAEIRIPAGARIAQLVVMPNLANRIQTREVPVHELNRNSLRAGKGWGSTGL